jgi:hypothetical protein
MTTTEPVVDVEANGSVPVPANPDGIEYLANGTARFTVEGKAYTLRAPTIGMFKRLHAAWIALANKPAGEQLAGQLEWVKLLFNGDETTAGLSDKRLDDDSDDWPAWLGVAAYQLQLMTHFRDVPLARGGSATAL